MIRPGCEYESALRSRAGEPDLEKLQVEAHEQMELLKQNEKEIVSGANVKMPASFTKPFDFSIELLVRSHPTLRLYCKQMTTTEVEPSYYLHPSQRLRIQPKDEIELKNVRKAGETNIGTISKTVSGSFVNQTEVPSYDLPGNFGVRAIETMPTDQRVVFTAQAKNLDFGAVYDERPVIMPELLERPDTNDYLTDEESDEATEFEVKVPPLDELVQQFEAEDDVIIKEALQHKEFTQDQLSKGFQPETRYSITDDKSNSIQMLNDNIHNQR